MSYNNATNTATFTPSASLAAQTTYTMNVSGARDPANNVMASVSWNFTTGTTSTTSTLWSNSVIPAVASANDTSRGRAWPKFTSDTAGSITGVRFYKGASNTGTHVAHLWSASGTLLASATFIDETATGWQQVSFASPVAIAANTTYVVSYFARCGWVCVEPELLYESRGWTMASFTHRRAATSSGNGVYRYGTSSGFPTSTFQEQLLGRPRCSAPASRTRRRRRLCRVHRHQRDRRRSERIRVGDVQRSCSRPEPS